MSMPIDLSFSFDSAQYCGRAARRCMSACRTGSLKPSHVLSAMGLLGDEARGSLRFSFGRFNTEAEVDRVLKIVPEVIAKLRALASALAG